MAATGRQQPLWHPPPPPVEGVQLPQLKIFNSLTRMKNDFVPLDPQGKKVTWYACGPTVYDDAHLGHARNYVSTDIIRRIMKDYFGFDLKFVMNITDVDDKIILRGRQQHLLERFKEKFPQLDRLLIDETESAFASYLRKNLPLVPKGTTAETYKTESDKAYQAVLDGKSLAGDGSPPGDKEAKIKMHMRTAASAAEALQLVSHGPPAIDVDTFYSKTEDILLPWVDLSGGTSIDASDHSIFTKLTKKFENRFFDDMRALNVLDPDVLTRVTEFGPEIVKFVEIIVKNGFGYATTDGSVYFDINAFEKNGNSYARLEPWNRNDQSLLADGEGALAKKTTEKRSDADFALWKASKPGEPAWPSPWGPGRPGWHIECSVMASETLGKVMDIHSGGIDLAFPHHDNELAQSEAYWLGETGCQHDHEWVKYFLHMGHLSIAGSKMSKSLKNFTTIREALARGDWTPRALRIVFLLGGWKEGVEITDELVRAGAAWEDKITNFFLKAKDVERNPSHTDPSSTTNDNSLLSSLSAKQTALDGALCDSFNTPTAMRILSDLVTDFNSLPPQSLTPESVLTTARWITHIVTILGLDGNASLADANRIGWAGVEIPPQAQNIVYPLSELRDAVRAQARGGEIKHAELAKLAEQTRPGKTQPVDALPYAEAASQFADEVEKLAAAEAPAKDLLALCDRLRDTHLWNLDVYLEDREPPLGAMVRPVDAGLKAARAQKEEAARAKAEAREKREREEAEKKRLKEEAAKVDPREMFRTAEWSAWDGEGVPTKDAKGEEVNKSRRKKLVKEWERQKKAHDEWVKGQGKA
ncbi:cysteinyl-tRNA synthetase [Trichodelitschia bisporula]|uniref:cysteine--tRNA ligase n=1 Tax=Trichodelitschia bisporula TaxID=703511 RepID=A0A6G1I4E8_9PEZI|nr:cysteinyl-tRNA synthetase [Trichodelitschia bisporula]